MRRKDRPLVQVRAWPQARGQRESALTPRGGFRSRPAVFAAQGCRVGVIVTEWTKSLLGRTPRRLRSGPRRHGFPVASWPGLRVRLAFGPFAEQYPFRATLPRPSARPPRPEKPAASLAASDNPVFSRVSGPRSSGHALGQAAIRTQIGAPNRIFRRQDNRPAGVSCGSCIRPLPAARSRRRRSDWQPPPPSAPPAG